MIPEALQQAGQRRVLVVLDRGRAWEYETVALSFADVPNCRVIVDRRAEDARGAPTDRRHTGCERRSGSLDHSGTVVLHVR